MASAKKEDGVSMLPPPQNDKVTLTFPGVKGHHGEEMKLSAAKKMIEDRMKYLSEATAFNETFNAFPWDGAYALNEVLTRIYGWTQQTATPTFFGPKPPQLVKIEIAPGQYANVPWGRINLPNADGGYLETGVDMKDGVFKFKISANILRKDEEVVRKVFDMVRAELRDHSIYRGKAIKMRFNDDDGNAIPLPTPEFLDTSKIDPSQLILSEDVMDAVEVNLFTPIQRVQDCLDNKIPVKRGVLLGGVFGTGKSLAAHVASKYAVDNGITFLYVPRADELAKAVAFAKQYQNPASVVFCEDIDRVTDGERSVEMDDLLNIIDGIDTKSSNIITVLTTNALNNINAAMLRPGRLDAVIDVTPPDAKAVEKLLRFYGGKSIDKSTDLTEASQALDGMIPAVVAEVVKRAKLAQLKFQLPGQSVKNLSGEALLSSAKTMAMQIKLLKDRSAPAVPSVTLDSVMESVVERVVGTRLEEVHANTKAIKSEVGA